MSNFQTYFRFLTDLLISQPPCLVDGSWDWDAFTQIAADQAIIPALGSRLPLAAPSFPFPPEVRDFFDSYRTLNKERNEQILSEIEGHAASLNHIGIEPIALKGLAYLLEGAYPDPSERLLLDVDLLIPQSRLDEAYALFQQTGFEPEIPDPSALTLLHKPALSRPDWITVELHHRLLDIPLLPPAEVARQSRPYQLGTSMLRLPSPEHQVIHLIAHSQIHHGYDQRIWPPLRAQYDLLRLTTHFGKQLDWNFIRSRFRQHHLEAVLDLHLLHVNAVLALPLPYETKPIGSTRWRWQRRKLLSRWPWVRFFDPYFLFRLWAWPRIHMAQYLWRVPGGRRYLIETPLRRSFYQKVREVFRGP